MKLSTKLKKQALATCLVALCATSPLAVTYAADTKAPAKAEQATGKVNINTADAKGIAAKLKGVGLKKAQAIVDYRKQLGGRYTSLNQLLEVKGIGEKTLQKLKPRLSL